MFCAIPQTGRCPNNCEDCFFQSGRSYLEPLEENLPNMPGPNNQAIGRIIRVNDGNDSNVDRDLVIASTKVYANKFYNTSIPKDLEKFGAPVVLTINPGKMTDVDFYKLKRIPKNLMFVRIRVNTWNLENVTIPAVNYYTEKKIPIVLTFMAYFGGKIPEDHEENYVFRKRTMNSYNAITTEAWEIIMSRFKYNMYVDSCGKTEGEMGTTKCRFCGNCLKHYYACKEKMRNKGRF